MGWHLVGWVHPPYGRFIVPPYLVAPYGRFLVPPVFVCEEGSQPTAGNRAQPCGRSCSLSCWLLRPCEVPWRRPHPEAGELPCPEAWHSGPRSANALCREPLGTP